MTYSRFSLSQILPMAVAATLFAAAPACAQQTLTVNGQGQAVTQPDMAQVVVGVQSDAAEAADALAEMNQSARAVLDRLLAEGSIDSADLRTGQLSLQPRLNYGEDGAEKDGFSAQTTIEVTLRDLTLLGGLLDTLVSDGANTLGGLNFGVADEAPHLEAARRAAVQDAMARAALYADAAGVTLGPVVSISEPVSQSGPMPMVAMEMARGAGVPVAPGTISFDASVVMVFDISAP